jgi:hypothetical protein
VANIQGKKKKKKKKKSQIWLHSRYERRQNKEILLYSWLPTGTYHKNLAIGIFFKN